MAVLILENVMINAYDGGIGIVPKKEEVSIYELLGMSVKMMNAMFEITNIEENVFNTYVYGKKKYGRTVLLFQCKKGLEKELIEKINERKIDGSF